MAEVDAYGLDPDKDYEDVQPCAEPDHQWGPWVLSPVYANREDRFCTVCGVMEMQWIDTEPGAEGSRD